MDQVVELQPSQRGRVRKPWTVVAVQDVPGEQSLREAECVSRDLWGPEIVVGYLAWNHFEATGPLQGCSR